MSLFKPADPSNPGGGAKVVGIQTDDNRAKFTETFKTGLVEPSDHPGGPRKLRVIEARTEPPKAEPVGAAKPTAPPPPTVDPASDPTDSGIDMDVDDADFLSEDEFEIHFNNALGAQVLETQLEALVTEEKDKEKNKAVKDTGTAVTSTGRRGGPQRQDNLAVLTHRIAGGALNTTGVDTKATERRKAEKREEEYLERKGKIERKEINRAEEKFVQNKEGVKEKQIDKEKSCD